MKLFSLFIIFSTLIYCIHSQTETYYISPTGDDTPTCGPEANPCRSIKYVTDSIMADRKNASLQILLFDGVYKGANNLNISWTGGDFLFSSADSNGGHAVIDAEFSSPIITQGSSSKTLLIRSITFANGNNTNGGCVSIIDAPNFSLQDVYFHNCYAEQYGGALYVEMQKEVQSISGTQGKFFQNSAKHGGAIALISSVSKGSVRQSVYSSEFTQNTAQSEGGAIYAKGYWYIADSEFTSNNATLGGALSLDGAAADNCTIVANNALMGGGVYFTGGSMIKDAFIHANKASSQGGGVYAIKVQKTVFPGSVYSIYGGMIDNNRAENYGGGLCVVENSNLRIGFVNITDNTNTEDNYGAGIYVSDGTFSFAGAVVSNNYKAGNLSDSSTTVNFFCTKAAYCPHICCTKPKTCEDCLRRSSDSSDSCVGDISGEPPKCIGGCANCHQVNSASVAIPIIVVLILVVLGIFGFIYFRRKKVAYKVVE
eukprot:TRINITY_DN914_c0_g1_i1.p1 TRINITY_DN914_c0_g1~~TRINITY_DN914_c0_g1_i1.p1  ORF type:complete len:483 (+),score=84.42 TRINITY_DN914_c0_g1_i1:110-1558(+)